MKEATELLDLAAPDEKSGAFFCGAMSVRFVDMMAPKNSRGRLFFEQYQMVGREGLEPPTSSV